MTFRKLVLLIAVVMMIGLLTVTCWRRTGRQWSVQRPQPQHTPGLVLPTIASSQLTSTVVPRAPASPQPTSAPIQPTTVPRPVCRIKSIVKIEEGSFPKWSAASDLIAFTKEVNSQFEIFTMKQDGSDITCLTCEKAALADGGHRGQAFWHPSGEYLAFTAEDIRYPRLGNGATARPGIGRNHNVWIMTSDGERFWKMTDYAENWGAIEARFSHDGTMLYWNEEFMMEKYPDGKPGDLVPHPGCYWSGKSLLFRKGEELCAWRVKYADMTFGPDGPTISNIRWVNPPDSFTLIEGTGFTPDDKGFIYSYASLADTGGSGLYGDIYASDLEGGSLTRLTHTPLRHDEDAEYSPDGRWIAYKEGTGVPGENMELYIMTSDGGNKNQLTDFTDPSREEYLPGALHITEIDWAPDGKRIIFGHVTEEKARSTKRFIPTGGPSLPSDLYMIALEGACVEQ